MAIFLSANVVRQAPPEGGATTRRKLLGGAAALAAAGTAAVVPAALSATVAAPALAVSTASPDAELIRACAEFVELDRQWSAIYNAPDAPADDDELNRLVAPIETANRALLDRICAARAITLEGHRARARALIAFAPDLPDQLRVDETWDYRLLRAVVSDLAGIVAPVSAGSAAGETDAELLALCREFDAQHAIVGAWNSGAVSQEVGEAAHARWWECVEQIEGIPAFTWEGAQAKASVANRAIWLVSDSESAVDDLVRYVLAEVAVWEVRGGRPVAALPRPEAEG